MMADEAILKGGQAKGSLIGWRSSSLKRVARSSAAAEVQAASNGQEDSRKHETCVPPDVTWTR